MSDKKIIEETTEQAVENAETFAEEVAKEDEKNTANQPEKAQEKVIVQKSGGKGLALLALLVALGVGGAGYFVGSQKLAEVESKIQALASKSGQVQTVAGESNAPTFEAEKAQLTELANAYTKASQRLEQLEQAQTSYTNQINGLQSQIQRVSGASQENSSHWILSEADFLLNNALRKIVLDNDLETAKNLLLEADSVLSKVNSSQAMNVRSAIKADLTSLNNVNQVDQNGLMQRLTSLANRLDDLPMVENEANEQAQSTEVSDSLQDWQQNIEKTANSFLDHFIRVSDRNKADEKAFVAPNQEVYLRENIRLRLQIAILAIPRQQNELYKKSLEAVGSWVRSYFETNNDNVKAFLKELDELSEESIYVDAPEKLQSLTLLNQALNRVPQAVEKIEINAEKALEPVKAEEKPAEQPSEQPKTETAQ